MGGFVRAVEVIAPDGTPVWPFTIPAIRAFGTRPFDAAVTYLVGENGSGKSTLVEALAVELGMNAEGGGRNMRFATTGPATPLAEHLVVDKAPGRPSTTFFLRAESFFNVASEINRLDEDPRDGPQIIEAYGGVSLHERSHGETFIATLTHRFRPGGLYLLDEPESALSFRGCLTLLRVIHDLTRLGAQFVIATHSPVVLATPGALIYLLDDEGVRPVAYDDAPPVRDSRAFLASPERFLRHLYGDGE